MQPIAPNVRETENARWLPLRQTTSSKGKLTPRDYTRIAVVGSSHVAPQDLNSANPSQVRFAQERSKHNRPSSRRTPIKASDRLPLYRGKTCGEHRIQKNSAGPNGDGVVVVVGIVCQLCFGCDRPEQHHERSASCDRSWSGGRVLGGCRMLAQRMPAPLPLQRSDQTMRANTVLRAGVMSGRLGVR